MRRAILRISSGLEHLRLWLLGQKWFSSRLLPAMPRGLRWAMRQIYLTPVDLCDRLRGHDTAVAPPRAVNYSGAVIDYEGSGNVLVRAFRDVAGLTPSSHVLDVGCGMGRLASAMAGFVGPDGSYDGLDIVPDGIEWCRHNIVGSHGNVRFTLSDVRNNEYNPRGSVEAVEYRFPFGDEQFDVIVLVSVFTHMVPNEVDHYLGEISRVLKPDGQCFATYFLLTPEARRRMGSRQSSVRFRHDYGSHWLVSTKVPELSVGYDDGFLDDLHARHGLTSDRYLGYWCGQPSYWAPDSGIGEQDVLVARKISSNRRRLGVVPPLLSTG